MGEPFKNLFNEKTIIAMGEHLAKAWPEFDRGAFAAMAAKNLDDLELKQRSAHIAEALTAFLPDDFERAAPIMLASLAPDDGRDIASADGNGRGIEGWAVMPMTDYVGLQGLDHFELWMMLLKGMTERSSSEFGIRFFLLAEPERTLSVLKTWVDDSNYHVRRLISEGTRPRLPWAMRLPVFMEDPTPILPLLEALKDDREEYVRRSVANNLNDIAKDHPEIVARIAGQWLKGADKNRRRLVRHACRTLIKQGHRGTLKALGYGPPRVALERLRISTPRVAFGTALEFELRLTSTADRAQALVVDYAIHHRKASGGSTPKVFKWKTTTLAPRATLRAKRQHTIKKITTRVYYPGRHRLEILVNGVSLGSEEFELIM
ncbi:MAG: DNA alkylation repair protein [Alphaproteobacteria bacterium]